MYTQNCVGIQNCVDTALSPLGAAVFMIIEPPEERIDDEVFTDYLSHPGQIINGEFLSTISCSEILYYPTAEQKY